MREASEMVTRREALRRVSLLLGGTVSASTIAGVLAWCEARPEAAKGEEVWTPRTLSSEQSETVALLGEHILPETDTPGASAARVHEFIDAMLTGYSSERERQQFLAGLARLDDRAVREFGKPFREATPAEQLRLVTALNAAAYADPRTGGGARVGEKQPVLQEGESETGRATGPGAASGSDEVTLNSDWAPEDLGRQSFFRRVKELVLIGYYTSEVGATRELSPNPMGRWEPDVPYSEVGHGWA